MTDSPRPELDMETQEFVHQLFDLARQGNSQRLEQLLQQGLPPNLRNHKGDSLLMLASYHATPTRYACCWPTRPTRTCATWPGRHRWPALRSRATWRWSNCSSPLAAARMMNAEATVALLSRPH